MKRWTIQEESLLSNTSLSVRELADLLPNRTTTGIQVHSAKLGIKRNHKFRLRKNYYTLANDQEFFQIINGELLGDGCVTKDKRGYCSFNYCTSNKEHIKELHSYIAKKTNSQSRIYQNKQKSRLYDGRIFKENVINQFIINHAVFRDFYSRWYYAGKKVVPNDIELTPLVTRHWYIGDGSISTVGSPVITLYTNSFSEDEVNLLVNKLIDVGIRAKRNFALKSKKQYSIRISGINVFVCLEYIGAPAVGYEYKWDTRDYLLYTRKCHCGNDFKFCSKSDQWKKYCSDNCRMTAKQQRKRGQ
jgi:hypothetical protein